MRKFTLLFFTVVAFIGLNAQENLISNGGFENWKADETPENWMGVKTSIDSADVLMSDTAPAIQGTYCLNLIRTSSSHKRFTTDSLEVKAGISYQISFFVKGDGEIRTALFDSEWGTYNAYVNATDEWTQVVQTVTAKNTATSGEFILSVRNTGVDGVFIDSVVVIELKNSAEILDFVLAEQIAPAMIDSDMAQVTATVMAGTDLTALMPELTISEGATQVTPTTVDPIDFTNDVTYIIEAEDGTQKTWNVSVLVAKPSIVTIHDIQFTEDASGASPYADSLVNTSGIVTAVAYNGFFLQDGEGGWNGIWVYTGDEPSVTAGDDVTVEGVVEEYHDLTEINKPYLVTVTSSGNELPAASVVALADFNEPYEGVLVTVESVSCTAEANEYGEWNVSDGTNEIVIDDVMFEYAPAIGEAFETITGCGTYTFGAYKLLPRSADDVVIVSVNDDMLSNAKVYPNPVSGTLFVDNLESVSELRISNVMGQQVYVKSVTETNVAINTANLEAGVYVITLVANDGKIRAERFIKE